MASDQGFALLVVLWTMVLLTLLAAQVTGAGRAETRLAAAMRTSSELQGAADGAIYETIWHLLEGSGDSWPVGSSVHVLDEPGGRVSVTLEDERGKIDVNQVPPALLQALFAGLGADPSTAQLAAASIVDWRTATANGGDSTDNVPPEYRMEGRAWGPPGQDFERLDELLLVRGMTPQLYRAALPYLTLDLEQGPWLDYAGPVILAGLARAKQVAGLAVEAADVRGPVVLRVVAKVVGPGGTAFTRTALLRLDGTLSGPAWKYRVLSWDSGEPPQA